MILAIDPGPIESAYVIISDGLFEVVEKGKIPNNELMERIPQLQGISHAAVEMIASYGMAVGKDVFETCVWIGRFIEVIAKNFHFEPTKIYRKDEKLCLCNSMKAKDSNIRMALIDRFGPVGTKKKPGYFYGFKKDIWAAMAVAVAYHDIYLTGEGL